MKNKLALLLTLSLFASPVFAKHKHHKHPISSRTFASPVVMISDSTGKYHYLKNTLRIVPIASISKLMAAIVVLESGLSLDERITITKADVVSSSKLKVGTSLTRGEMLNAALMSSDNRAAHCITRTMTGNVTDAVNLMNKKAASLGMISTSFVEPTGLDKRNRSTAADLSKLLAHASHNPDITKYSTMSSNSINKQPFFNTNAYVRSGVWNNVVVSKTGFTNAAGKCIAVTLSFGNRLYDIVILGAKDKKQRLNDLATAKRMIVAQL